MYCVIWFGFLTGVLEERDVLCAAVTFILCSNALYRGAWRTTSPYFGVCFSAWEVLHCFPSCTYLGNVYTVLSLGKRKNDLDIAKLFGAQQKNTYIALVKAL